MKNKSIVDIERNNQDKILSLFDKPKLIGIVGDPNSGKSNLLYWIIRELQIAHKFNLYTYGLRLYVKEERKIYSVEQMETIQNSIIIIDEFANLFDVDDRNKRKQIENSLRLIFHNNNIILFCGLPENYKKFLASKLNALIFKKSTLADFINGSRTKKVVHNCEMPEKGSAMFYIPHDLAVVYDGKHYYRVTVPYIKDVDTKLNNPPILNPAK